MKNASDKLFSLLLTFIFILGLSACGGGGSSGGDNTVATAFTLRDQGLGNRAYVASLANDGSGDVYVGGTFASYNDTSSNKIIRLNSDGTVDNDFAVGDGFNDMVITIAPATDGSGDIYVGGSFASYNGSDSSNIIRLNSDGTVDTAFNVGTGFNSSPVYSIAPTSDGSGDIYIGGTFTSYNGTTSNRIIRLNSDGSVDTAFAVNTGFDSDVWTIALANDGTGDIYVGGGFTSYTSYDSVAAASVTTISNRIIRLNSNGSVDTTFNVGTGFNNVARTIVTATDGSGDIYVGGNFTSHNGTASNYLIRLNSNGSVDSAFAMGAGFNSYVASIASATDGSGDIYVGGGFTSYDGSASNRIIRLNSNGSVDTGFAVGSGFDSTVYTIIPTTDGSGDIFAAGFFASYDDVVSGGLVSLSSTGTMLRAYSTNAAFNEEVTATAVAVDGSGDIYVGGLFTSYNGSFSGGLIRLNNDGTVDGEFDVGVGFYDDTGEYVTEALAPAIDGSGDIYVGGAFSSYNGNSSNSIIRLNSDSSMDSAFAVGSGFNNPVYTLALSIDGSGDIYVGGMFTSYNGTSSNRIVRLNSDGSVDSAFAVGSGFDSTVYTIIPANDGSGDIYVGGLFTSYNGTACNYLIRLNSDGSVDTVMNSGSFTGTLRTLALANDGSGDIYAGGMFSIGGSFSTLLRLNSDGTVDTDFSLVAELSGVTATNRITNATDGSGDIYVAGSFYDGTYSDRIIRFNSDDTVDSAFDIGRGFNDGGITTIAPATDGSGNIYVGGMFASYKTTTVLGIVSLKPDGSIN